MVLHFVAHWILAVIPSEMEDGELHKLLKCSEVQSLIRFDHLPCGMGKYKCGFKDIYCFQAFRKVFDIFNLANSFLNLLPVHQSYFRTGKFFSAPLKCVLRSFIFFLILPL